ncbi:hypothetical protein Tco_1509427 [Tanacetum coccineum]
MIFKRPVPIPALLCSIGLITNHGHNESICIVEEGNMDCKFFNRLFSRPFELGTQGIHTELPLRRCPVPPILCFKDYPKISTSSINHNIEAKAIWDNVKMLLAGSELTKEDRESQLYDEFERFKMLLVLDEEELLFMASEQGNTFDVDLDNQPVQDLALNEDNIFQADECDAFDSDVDDEPTAQTIFMSNLSSARSANPQAGPSNASILSESNVIDSTSLTTGNSNVIPYETILSSIIFLFVPSCASFTLNNVCVSSDNDAFVPHDPIANELKIYKEQVAIYEQRAKFELTEREQRMDDQMRMLIQNRNKTKENLKKELHSVKLKLNSTMENNKIFEETVTTL